MKKLLPIVLLSIVACSKTEKSPVSVSSGTIVRLDSFQSEFVTKRNVDIWLPAGYSTDRTYRVLYMHDGQMLFDSTMTWNKQEWKADEIAAQLIGSGAVDPFIIVGVWNSGIDRHSDYFPQKPFESLPGTVTDSIVMEAKASGQSYIFSNGVQSDAYLQFLVTELKPYIDRNFSVFTDRANTFVAGSSMGGLISMYAICEYPDVFGGAGCLSTHWPGAFPTEGSPFPLAFQTYLMSRLPEPSTHKIYFDFGTETLDEFYEPHQIAVDSVMRARSFDSTNWMTRKFEGADHSEKAWSNRLDIPLTFLMRKDD